MWEAQFGDFANGAQVIIDPIHSLPRNRSGSARAASRCLLPHGYEGQGPEAFIRASGAFPPTLRRGQHAGLQSPTPRQYFHVLRRQMKRPFRKPLILMTPKSMLRLEAAASKVEDFTNDRFHEILPGPLLDSRRRSSA